MNTIINIGLRGYPSIRNVIKVLPRPISYLNNKNQIKYLPKRYFASVSEVGSKNYFSDIISKNKVVIFMKGTPDAPKCGFSNAVVQILRMHGVDSYDSYNVLEDDKIRQGIKEYSDWPTIPQVYLNGEFVGGCDIFIQMHQNGDLIEELQKAGIQSAVLKEAINKEDSEKKT